MSEAAKMTGSRLTFTSVYHTDPECDRLHRSSRTVRHLTKQEIEYHGLVECRLCKTRRGDGE